MLYSVAAANALIATGQPLTIAGDENALARLQRGRWIGGTIPYFLTRKGGLVDRERVFVTGLPKEARGTRIGFVGADDLAALPRQAPEHGLSLVIVPGLSPVHLAYAVGVHNLPDFFTKPIAGWVSGVHLDDLARVKPKVFNGETGEASTDRLVALHADLPPSLSAIIGIVNLFRQGDGDRIRFANTGFAAQECWINGRKTDLYDYVKTHAVDLRLPLVADLSGEMINVSFQTVDDASHSVKFYAPVLSDIEYRQAAPLAGDYRDALLGQLARHPITPFFACNCILNYLYAGLEGDRPIDVEGPATFGEIAYILLNQTLVHIDLRSN